MITLGLRLSLDLDKGAVGNGLLIKTKAVGFGYSNQAVLLKGGKVWLMLSL